ncbi:DUF481 domain-containing protein [Ferrimonas marina]|uniref:Putative salt-induced outer membrane protein n=1 Tax=Ferrimonas marina TaxID=299255 RepID=A0A1M5X9Z0_9GAMM|nr:DUF481 domain-containing protein [Ferrimonas marina]SHH96378.1 putative salt-induced outer membrane protein [Ferrimonas marina]
MRHYSFLLLFATGPAFALVPPDYKEPTTDFTAELELGLQYNSGNTESSSFNSRGRLIYDMENARHDTTLRGYFASDNETTSAEQYQVQYQLDYKLEGTRYVFGRADMLWDRFGSYVQQHIASVGYGYNPVDRKHTKWTLEGGVGYRYNEANLSNTEDPDQNATDDEAIVRIASKLEHRLQEYTSFNADATIETGSLNTVANLNLSYRNQLWADLALKIGMDIKYTDVIPEGTEHTDVISTVNLLYTFR